jgi:DNA repair protein RecO (recombination protein O)
MQIFTTKGIVLRTIKYGETSIIATVYTELFGLQSYIIKGVRKQSQKVAFKANFFQPSALLEMEVYNNPHKQLQFVKNYSWSVVYKNIFSNVVSNTVALFIVELLYHCLKHPEANTKLFQLVEDALHNTDSENKKIIGNIPLYFTLQLCSNLGFKIQGSYTQKTPILDFKEGLFTSELPNHSYFTTNQNAEYISNLQTITQYSSLANIQLKRTIKKELLQNLLQYFAIHIYDFGTLKSYQILQEVLD